MSENKISHIEGENGQKPSVRCHYIGKSWCGFWLVRAWALVAWHALVEKHDQGGARFYRLARLFRDFFAHVWLFVFVTGLFWAFFAHVWLFVFVACLFRVFFAHVSFRVFFCQTLLFFFLRTCRFVFQKNKSTQHCNSALLLAREAFLSKYALRDLLYWNYSTLW